MSLLTCDLGVSEVAEAEALEVTCLVCSSTQAAATAAGEVEGFINVVAGDLLRLQFCPLQRLQNGRSELSLQAKLFQQGLGRGELQCSAVD